jgi:hypothetical protein
MVAAGVPAVSLFLLAHAGATTTRSGRRAATREEERAGRRIVFKARLMYTRPCHRATTRFVNRLSFPALTLLYIVK